MKSTNLLIIGGAVVLGGLYLTNKNKKSKADTQALIDAQAEALANSQLQSKPDSVVSSVNNQSLLTPKEATIYATNTIASVNSLIEKYPIISKAEFLSQYNKRHKSNLIIDKDGNIIENPSNPNTQSAVVGMFLFKNNEIDANKEYKYLELIYNHWKLDFSTIYSNLKDYFSTLTKENADIIVKYLPKFIIQTFMGDNDPRASVNDFYSQKEIMDMVDNKLNQESILKSALDKFFSNMRNLGGYGYQTPTTQAVLNNDINTEHQNTLANLNTRANLINNNPYEIPLY